ncbi:tetratricopeptide repeat protein [Spirochaeta cellobiosiphila]|uniref:tetratricopeptide repeat protein n=1 Tax=Spirochaeta cellobiosiphila TaxID=504483 RepID=UPI00040E37A0|nr:tetratricopeptide repeat protein [Spirochaeta cellobiosiphila]
MHQNEELTLKQKFISGLITFFQKNRVFFIIVLVLLIAAVIGLAVYDSYHKDSVDTQIAKVEVIENEYQTLQVASDKEAKLNNLIEEINNLESSESLSKWPKQRLLFLTGKVYFDLQNWSEAADTYLETANVQSSYLTTLSLFNASVAYEQNGDLNKALEILDQLESYDDEAVEKIHGLFNKGRLLEKLNRTPEAIEIYQSLETKYPNSDWTKLAKERIIKIK